MPTDRTDSARKVGGVTLLCLLVGGLSLLGLLGHALSRTGMGALGTTSMPMSAPSALVMLLLAGATLAPTLSSARGRRVSLVLVGLVVVVIGFGLAGQVAVLHPSTLLTTRGPHLSFPSALAGLMAALALGLRWAWTPASWTLRQGSAGAALGTLSLGAMAVIGHVVGAPGLYDTQRPPMSLASSLAALLLGAALVRLAGRDVLPLSLFRPVSGGSEALGGRASTRGPLALFLGTVVIILLGGHLFLRQQFLDARQSAKAGLLDIAELKAREISQWHRDRLDGASRMTRSHLVHERLSRFLGGAREPALQAEVADWLVQQVRGDWAFAALFDAQGKVQLASPEGSPFARENLDWELVNRALQSRDRQVMDLHRDPDQPDAHLTLWIPLLSSPEGQGRPYGVLLLVVDPRLFLFPLLQSRPTSSTTAETLLVRQDGDHVVYLNELRHRPGAPLSLRTPLNQARPGAEDLALRGHPHDLVAGLDYRQEPVLAAIRPVEGTPWSLVAKVDEAEIYGPLRSRAWGGAVGLFALMGCAALGIGLVLRYRETDAQRIQLGLLQRFEWLMREANDIILLLDGEGRILEANVQAAEQYGYSAEELKGMNVLDLRSPETQSLGVSQFAQARETGAVRFETIHQRRDGSLFPVEVSARAVTDQGGLQVITFIRDTTEQVARNREIQRMTRLYAAMGEVGQAIARSDSPEDLFGRVSRVMVQSGGFAMAWVGWEQPLTHQVTVAARFGDEDDLLGSAEVRTDATPGGQGAVGTAIRQGRPCVVNDIAEAPGVVPWQSALAASGFMATAAFPIRVAGQVKGALAVYAREKGIFGDHEVTLLDEAARDISFALDHLAEQAQRRETEEALRESEQFLKEAQDAGGIGTFTWDIRQNRWHGSTSLDRLFGTDTRHPRTLKGWMLLVPADLRSGVAAQVRAAFAGSDRFELEYPICRPSDGALRWLQGRGEVLRNEAGAPLSLVGIMQDITERRDGEEERKRLQSQLHQAQKLESLGSLAGGVAHDMNNVLGAILSLASSLRELADPFSRESKNLDTIISACMRGRGVVKSLLYFARKDLQEERAIDLNDLVREMSHLLGHTMLQRVHLQMDLEEDLGTVRGDGGALSHALMNLCVNAMDAMPEGGVIHILTSADADGGVSLRVRDTGEGMPPEVMAKAMEPFFTTKPQGKGTGLGLAMVYGTMKAHEGELELHSLKGQGTEVVLRFPAERVTLSAPRSAAPAVSQEVQQPLRILLVDDDDLIREAVPPMLELLGHRVLAAAGGLSALRILETGEPLDLVVLDMNMPGMSGAEVLPRILELRPGLQVILATGFSDHEVAPLMEGRSEVFSLRKPFSLKEFQHKISTLRFPLTVAGDP